MKNAEKKNDVKTLLAKAVALEWKFKVEVNVLDKVLWVLSK